MRGIVFGILFLLSIGVGLYVGLYLCFIGGFMALVPEVVKLFNGGDPNGFVIGVSILRIVVTAPVTFLTFSICAKLSIYITTR